jgi:hypothetical protein
MYVVYRLVSCRENLQINAFVGKREVIRSHTPTSTSQVEHVRAIQAARDQRFEKGDVDFFLLFSHFFQDLGKKGCEAILAAHRSYVVEACSSESHHVAGTLLTVS